MTTFLLKRDSGYYFRYVIPQRLRPYASQSEVRYSLQTHSRRTAKRLARVLAFKVESRLLEAEALDVQLNGKDIRETLQRYLQEGHERIVRWHDDEVRTYDSIEAQQGVLSDLIQDLESALITSDYRDAAPKVAELFGLSAPPPKGTDERTIFNAACRKWTTNTLEIYGLLDDLLSGKDVDTLAVLSPQPMAVPQSLR